MEQKKGKRKILIGVAWPYVNGDLHIGHLAGYLLPADITSRYQRAIGNDVLMVSGSDCYGTPITIEADQKGITPKEVADIYHKKNVHLFNDVLKLTYDLYTRTDTDHHAKITQEFFLEFLKKGYLFVETTKQYYSEQEKRFLPDRYVIGTCKNCGFTDARSDQCDNCGKLLSQDELENPHSKMTGSAVVFRETKHYFIDWAKLEPEIKNYVEKTGPKWKQWVFSESIGWLKQGLIPRAITRDIDWGVEIPTDEIPPEMRIDGAKNKRIYVWFDAVIGYYSASLLWAEKTGKDWKEYWYNKESKHYYFMGKDNLIFHTLFWPGQLIVKDKELHLPDLTSINMFLDYDGKKFSKSRGMSLGIDEMVSSFGNNALRFYLTLIMPETKDSSFKWPDFLEKNNGVLVANLGNFIHRVLSISKDTDTSQTNDLAVSEETRSEINKAFERSRKYLENCQFRDYLDAICDLSDFGNRVLGQEKLWILKNQNTEAYLKSLKNYYAIILALGYLIYPLMPEASDELAKNLGIENFHVWPEEKNELDHINSLFGIFVHPELPTPIFRKITQEEIDNFSQG
ncbi:MAG: methionine--tRNA ligase [Candidatus Shapirobacteria bacterium]|jgi:methionyl-tRNA synthetase